MKKIIIDLDNTLTKDDSLFSYKDQKLKIEVVNKLKRYKSFGVEKGGYVDDKAIRPQDFIDSNYDQIKSLINT